MAMLVITRGYDLEMGQDLVFFPFLGNHLAEPAIVRVPFGLSTRVLTHKHLAELSQENPAMQPLLPRGDLGDQVRAVLGVFLLLRQDRIGDGQWLSSTNSDIWGSCGFPIWLLSGLPWP